MLEELIFVFVNVGFAFLFAAMFLYIGYHAGYERGIRAAWQERRKSERRIT